MQAALQGHGESDVPCGGCTACCTLSQFVQQHEHFLRTDETTGRITTTRPPPDEVRVALTRRSRQPRASMPT
jgi:hypothetical protein